MKRKVEIFDNEDGWLFCEGHPPIADFEAAARDWIREHDELDPDDDVWGVGPGELRETDVSRYWNDDDASERDERLHRVEPTRRQRIAYRIVSALEALVWPPKGWKPGIPQTRRERARWGAYLRLRRLVSVRPYTHHVR